MGEQKKEVVELNENSTTATGQKINQSKQNDKKKKVKKLSARSKYFDFYDDVKAGCHKVIDW